MVKMGDHDIVLQGFCNACHYHDQPALHEFRTAQHSTAQHCTAEHSRAQHSTAQHSTAQHSTAQHSTAQHSTAQHSTAKQCTAAQRSTVQRCAAAIMRLSSDPLWGDAALGSSNNETQQ